MKSIIEYLQSGHLNTGNTSLIKNFYVDDPIKHTKVKDALSKEELVNYLKIQLGVKEYTFGSAFFEAYIPMSELENMTLNGEEIVELVQHIFADILKKTTLSNITLYKPTPGQKSYTHESFAYYGEYNDKRRRWGYCYYSELNDTLKRIFEPLNKEVNKF